MCIHVSMKYENSMLSNIYKCSKISKSTDIHDNDNLLETKINVIITKYARKLL